MSENASDPLMLTNLGLFLVSAVKRSALLKHGRIDIVQFIRDLPRTKHCVELFEVDVMAMVKLQIGMSFHIGVDCAGGASVS